MTVDTKNSESKGREMTAGERETPNEPQTAEVTEWEAKLKEAEQKYLYLYADFENYKKRSEREKQDLRKFGWESVAYDLLNVLDNLDLALAHAAKSQDKAIGEGVKMVLKMLEETLKRYGVEPIELDGKAFDPTLHEAVGEQPSEGPEGQILEVRGRGYLFHGRLLRPARVVVSTRNHESI